MEFVHDAIVIGASTTCAHGAACIVGKRASRSYVLSTTGMYSDLV